MLAHLDQASRESKNTENEELKSLKESFVAMAIVARWEGERREHLSLLKSNETKSKLELKTRVEELRDVEKVNEDMRGWWLNSKQLSNLRALIMRARLP